MIATLIALISSPLLSNDGMTPDACERIQLQLQQSKPEETEAARSALDWPDLCKYAAQNGEVTVRPRVVFIGDSITEFWLRSQPEYFVAGYLDRGISGQTSSQILLRFYQDAIALRPSVVHVMVGTNDVAGNTGPESPETWKNNIRAMVAIARYYRVRLVFGSLLPADAFWWRPSVRPARQIAQLNEWLRSFCRSNGIPFINYYDVMATSTGGLKREFSDDGVHPNKRGYEVMRSTASPVLDKMVR